MRLIETQIDVAASASSVWKILTDFPAYSDWNPFITEIEGTPELSARLRIRICPPGRSAITLKPTILVASCRASSTASIASRLGPTGGPVVSINPNVLRASW